MFVLDMVAHDAGLGKEEYREMYAKLGVLKAMLLKLRELFAKVY